MENDKRYGMPDDENMRGQQHNNEYERQNAKDKSDNWESTELDDADTSKAHFGSRHDDRDMRDHNKLTHNSADDQPSTTTDTNRGRDRNL